MKLVKLTLLVVLVLDLFFTEFMRDDVIVLDWDGVMHKQDDDTFTTQGMATWAG